MDQRNKQNLQRVIVEALHEEKNEQDNLVNDIVEKIDKRIIPKDFYKDIRERPVADVILGFLALIGICLLWFIGGLIIIRFSPIHLCF